MKRTIISVIICLAIAVFGIHTGNAAEQLKNCGNSNPMFIDVGDIIDCEIVKIGGSRSFKFDASDGDKIRLTMVDGTSDTPLPYLTLYDPDDVLISNWYVQNGGRQVDYSLTKTGKYTIVISEYYNFYEVEFRIALQGIVPSPPKARRICHDDQYKDDIDPFADSDVFFFNGTVGDKIRLTMVDGTSGSPLPYLTLYDPDDVLISNWYVQNGGRQVDYSLTKTGKYTIVISEYYNFYEVAYILTFTCISGKCYACPSCLPFEDVCKGYWAYEEILDIYEAGITTGCSTNPLKYCPLRDVNRAQMAVFLERGINDGDYTPPPATGIFDDVPVTHWAADWIEQLYKDGITTGCAKSPLKYCPDRAVNRAQMAVFLLRAKHEKNYTPPKATGIFKDVPVTYWAADWIEQLYKEGITTGCSTNPLKYCPLKAVNRAQMAVFLARTFGL